MSGNIDRKHGLVGGLFLLSLGIGLAACAGATDGTEGGPTAPVAGQGAPVVPPVGGTATGAATSPTGAATTATGPTTATAPTGTGPASTAAAANPSAGAANPAAGAAPGTPPAAGVTAPAGGAVTYQHDIRPIVEARCLGCHIAGGVGPFELDSWDKVNMMKTAIMPAVTSHRMPPWPADDTNCVKQRNKQRLSDAQIALFTSWQAAGFPQGEPTEFAPLVEDEPVKEIGAPTLMVKPDPYQLTANYEGYICSQTDANLTKDTWVTALDVKPEHPEYVHHAIVNIGGGQCDALGVSAENLYSYRPGSRTVVFEDGDAMLLGAGQRIAIQFHFNTRGAKPAATYPTDSSPLRLWTLPDGQKPMRQIHRQPIHAFNISIPVGAVNQPVDTSQALEAGAGAEIIGISPHMHLLGQTFSEKLAGGPPGSECLVNIPDWDQSWQIDYLYKPEAYIKASAGMTVSQECVYSNRPEDQGIGPDGKPYTPQLTTFGEDTRNEMCLGYIWYRQAVAGGGFN